MWWRWSNSSRRRRRYCQHQRQQPSAEQRHAEASKAGDLHAGGRRFQLLCVPAAVSCLHAVGDHGQRRGCRTFGYLRILQSAVLLTLHAVPQLGHESHTLQPDVLEVPQRLLASAAQLPGQALASSSPSSSLSSLCACHGTQSAPGNTATR